MVKRPERETNYSMPRLRCIKLHNALDEQVRAYTRRIWLDVKPGLVKSLFVCRTFRIRNSAGKMVNYPDWDRDTPRTYAVVTYRKVHIWSSIYVYTKESSWNPNSKTLDPDRPQYNRPASSVIAQQYSIASFVSLRIQSLTINSARVYKLLFQFPTWYVILPSTSRFSKWYPSFM